MTWKPSSRKRKESMQFFTSPSIKHDLTPEIALVIADIAEAVLRVINQQTDLYFLWAIMNYFLYTISDFFRIYCLISHWVFYIHEHNIWYHIIKKYIKH